MVTTPEEEEVFTLEGSVSLSLEILRELSEREYGPSQYIVPIGQSKPKVVLPSSVSVNVVREDDPSQGLDDLANLEEPWVDSSTKNHFLGFEILFDHQLQDSDEEGADPSINASQSKDEEGADPSINASQSKDEEGANPSIKRILDNSKYTHKISRYIYFMRHSSTNTGWCCNGGGCEAVVRAISNAVFVIFEVEVKTSQDGPFCAIQESKTSWSNQVSPKTNRSKKIDGYEFVKVVMATKHNLFQHTTPPRTFKHWQSPRSPKIANQGGQGPPHSSHPHKIDNQAISIYKNKVLHGLWKDQKNYNGTNDMLGKCEQVSDLRCNLTINVAAREMPELLNFDKDLIHLEATSKIQLKSLAEEMQAMSKGLEKVEQEFTASENDGAISAGFQKALKNFLDTAEAEVRSLISLYSDVQEATIEERTMMEHRRRPLSIDQSSPTTFSPKRHKADLSISSKERKEKLSKRIGALQQLVSPYGKV
ncbi:hypothetical protein TEA_011394 [Camellia sinensis var. sinensis]|uniref:FH2 domain-containing protein n=1 Tax=Camellia sinensis var. sinensis TaxID=542762 RepID=A0A4S4EJD8_CAMSN|nr:hypothetical protein TEA_011394 [Camellia sinensis var. sinensis]